MAKLISPSLLSANFGKLQEEVEMINNSEADWIHIDVMDGVFVPNISFGFPVLKYIKQYAVKPLDVHLMIIQPDKYFNRFKEYGADVLTIHYEGAVHLHRSVNAIKDLGMKAGVAINPHSPVNVLEEIITEIDLVLIMSVNPGFAAQRFIDNTYNKIETLRNMVLRKNAQTLIEVDGGVDFSNAERLFETGANVLVAGNSVFSSPNPKKAISDLKK